MSDRTPNQADLIREDVKRLTSELDTALAKLEELGGGEEWKLRSRLLRLEAEYLLANQPVPERSKRERFVAGLRGFLSFLAGLLGKLSPVATPLAIAIVGYYLTGTYTELLDLRRVEVAEQQLDLQTIKEMDTHFQTFRRKDIGIEEAGELADRIARFGPRAIPPLVAELSGVTSATEPRAQALQHSLALTAIDPVQRRHLCEVLGDAISTGENDLLGTVGLEIAQDIRTRVRCE